MKVFLVINEVEYESADVAAVFSTKRRAKAYQKRCEDALNKLGDESWYVTEWIVDERWGKP